MAKLYYLPPPQEAFEEMKKACIEVWALYDDEYGYATDKINSIKDIKNVRDNFMYMLAMFDINNQRKVADKLTPATKREVRLRMIDGGNEAWYIAQVLGYDRALCADCGNPECDLTCTEKP